MGFICILNHVRFIISLTNLRLFFYTDDGKRNGDRYAASSPLYLCSCFPLFYVLQFLFSTITMEDEMKAVSKIFKGTWVPCFHFYIPLSIALSVLNCFIVYLFPYSKKEKGRGDAYVKVVTRPDSISGL